MTFECCYKCETRKPGCHSHCEKYAEAKERHDGFRMKLFEQRSKEYDLESRAVEINYRRLKEKTK